MIVYIESNFVLELALGQEHVASAESIAGLAETGAIKLALPSFALSEPFSNLGYRRVERKHLGDDLVKQITQLQRSLPHQQLVTQLQPIAPLLAQIYTAEVDALEHVVERLLIASTLIEADLASFRQALQYKVQYGLTSQDSIIYAAIVSHIQRQDRQETKCFLSQNVKDFYLPGIEAELRTYNCRFIGDFEDGLAFIQAQLRRQGDQH